MSGAPWAPADLRQRAQCMSGVTARRVAVATGAAALLAVVAGSLNAAFQVWDRPDSILGWSAAIVTWAFFVLLPFAVAPRLATVTGSAAWARAAAIFGSGIAVLGGGLLVLLTLDLVDPGDGGGVALAVIAGFGGAALFWLAAVVWLLLAGRPVESSGLRLYRRLTATVLGGSIALFGLMAVVAAIFVIGLDRSAPMQLAFAYGLGSLGFLAGILLAGLQPTVARRLDRNRHRRAETLDPDATLDFDCPECGTSMTAGRGHGVCRRCRTVVRVTIEEPRCDCGYALFRLTGDACPECGAVIPGADRFAETRYLRAGAGPPPPPAPPPPAPPPPPGAGPTSASADRAAAPPPSIPRETDEPDGSVPPGGLGDA